MHFLTYVTSTLACIYLAHAAAIQQSPALPGAQAISPADRIYTGDQSSNTITVISPATNTVLGTINLGDSRLTNMLNPQYLRAVNVHGVGFSRDGQFLASISVTSNTLTVIRTRDNSIVSQTAVGRAAHEAMFAADNKTVWVASRGTSFIDLVDGINGGVIGRIQTDAGPSKVLFSPDGKTAYVNHIQSPTFSYIDVASRTVIATVKMPFTFSSDWMLSADGKTAWLAHKQDSKTSVVDIFARRVVTVMDTGLESNHPHFAYINFQLHGFITVAALNQTKVYRQDCPNCVPVFITTIQSSGVEPHGLAASPDNTRMYILNEHSDTVDVVDLSTFKIIKTLNVGQEGQGLVYIANAVPSGSGTTNLGQSGLNLRVENVLIEFPGIHGPTSSSALVTVREMVGLDMFQLIGREIKQNTTFVASANLIGTNTRVPLVTFAGTQLLPDGCANAPQILQFSKFFGVYDPKSLQVAELSSSNAGPTVS